MLPTDKLEQLAIDSRKLFLLLFNSLFLSSVSILSIDERNDLSLFFSLDLKFNFTTADTRCSSSCKEKVDNQQIQNSFEERTDFFI